MLPLIGRKEKAAGVVNGNDTRFVVGIHSHIMGRDWNWEQ